MNTYHFHRLTLSAVLVLRCRSIYFTEEVLRASLVFCSSRNIVMLIDEMNCTMQGLSHLFIRFILIE
jgi:hypothetical protein